MADTVLLADNTNGQPHAVRDERVLVNGEVWDLVRTVEQIAEIMREHKVPSNAKRTRVLSELQIAGCWPTRAALKNYTKGQGP
jgi:hypothetical protein